jgi:hypothetical protein
MLLAVHNLLRWAVLGLAVVALLRALKGIRGDTDYMASGARRSLSFFTMALHLQLVLGVIVYAMSPLVRRALGDMAGAMKDPGVRFFVVEHPTLMLAGVIVATVTGVIARRGPDDAVKHRRAAIGIALALGLVLAGVPWHRAIFPSF